MGLVVLHLHLHGLFRGHDLEVGRDADCGGQTIYVSDLAFRLAQCSGVEQVEVLTRLIRDASVSQDYGLALEPVHPRFCIRRLPFGPPDYLAKEALWPFLDELVCRLEAVLRASPRLPDWIHAHYADAGYVGARLQQRLQVPLVFTGHSLGREKRRRLLQAGHDPGRIERRYHLARRIAAEELALAHSSLVVTSTHQELAGQYGRYLRFRPERACVIPPGVDAELFHPPGTACDPTTAAQLVPQLAAQLARPDRPPLLALCRPDPRKNIAALVDAFGRSSVLRQRHNLVLALGSALEMPLAAASSPDAPAEAVLALVNRHGLHGRVALLRQLPRQAIPALYRWAAARGGLFVNPALTEPFGLTLLEAAACGLPVVATDDGGPREILARCGHGLLVDVSDAAALRRALEEAGADPVRWRRWSGAGVAAVARHYSWRAHTDRYLEALATCRPLRPLASVRMAAAGHGGRSQGAGLAPLPGDCCALDSGIQ